MKRISKWVISLLIPIVIGGAFFMPIFSQNVFAATCNKTYLGFPAWYNGLEVVDTTTCSVKTPTTADGKNVVGPFVWTIALNVIDMALVLVGYISVFFILYGGFSFIVNSGNSDVIAKSRQTIMNAVIGLIISIASIAIVNLIAGIINP